MAAARLRVFHRGDLPAFGGNSLPLTMYLANLVRPMLLPTLNDSPTKWAYEDRVLVMLAPTMRQQVEEFYEGHGEDLAMMLKARIEPMDRLLVETLRTLIMQIAPEMAIALADAECTKTAKP